MDQSPNNAGLQLKNLSSANQFQFPNQQPGNTPSNYRTGERTSFKLHLPLTPSAYRGSTAPKILIDQ